MQQDNCKNNQKYSFGYELFKYPNILHVYFLNTYTRYDQKKLKLIVIFNFFEKKKNLILSPSK